MHAQLQDLSSVKISGQYIYNFFYIICYALYITAQMLRYTQSLKNGGHLGFDQAARGYEESCNYAGICAYTCIGHSVKISGQYIQIFFFT